VIQPRLQLDCRLVPHAGRTTVPFSRSCCSSWRRLRPHSISRVSGSRPYGRVLVACARPARAAFRFKLVFSQLQGELRKTKDRRGITRFEECTGRIPRHAGKAQVDLIHEFYVNASAFIHRICPLRLMHSLPAIYFWLRCSKWMNPAEPKNWWLREWENGTQGVGVGRTGSSLQSKFKRDRRR
jgi:hypothetical protein